MLPLIQVVVDGHVVEAARPPRVVGGTVLVPLGDLRFLAQRVWYQAKDRSITVQRGDRQIVLFVGRDDAWINGLPGAVSRSPLRIGGALYVPLAACARALGADVVYEGAAHTIAVTLPPLTLMRFTPPPTPLFVPTPIPSPTPSASPSPSALPAATPSPEATVPQPRRTPLSVPPSWP